MQGSVRGKEGCALEGTPGSAWPRCIAGGGVSTFFRSNLVREEYVVMRLRAGIYLSLEI